MQVKTRLQQSAVIGNQPTAWKIFLWRFHLFLTWKVQFDSQFCETIEHLVLVYVNNLFCAFLIVSSCHVSWKPWKRRRAQTFSSPANTVTSKLLRSTREFMKEQIFIPIAKNKKGIGRWGVVGHWFLAEHLDGDEGWLWRWGGGYPLSATFSFQRDAEDAHSPHSTPTMRLSLMLNTLQTEHVNTPGEHIWML